MQPFGRNRFGPKIGVCVPLGEGELGRHLTQCGQGRGLSACQVSSLSVQPFDHSARTSQTGQTGQTDKGTDSIGRTVLHTVAQKCLYLTLHAVYSDACSYYSKMTLTLYTRQSLCMFAYSIMCVRDFVFR